LVLGLSGTDIYGQTERPEFLASIELASRMVALQPLAIERLPAEAQRKARAIFQSAMPAAPAPPPAPARAFAVAVAAHLRPVQAPFRAAEAARLLPTSSTVCILQIGSALDDEMAARARREAAENPRYRFLGGRPRLESRRLVAGCQALVLSSRMEGGANVIS